MSFHPPMVLRKRAPRPSSRGSTMTTAGSARRQDLDRVRLDGLAHGHELEDVETTLATFVLCYEALRLLQTSGHGLLGQTGRLARLP